ncbi:MAG TPA: hypothetical protein VHS05_02415 [Pyrinomonadaceae bacterium]|nr:hypothetical protein [Pyrinomonadaceae bacterium]
MKKKKTKLAKSARRFPRLAVMIIAGIAVLAIAAITVVSRQSANSNKTEKVANATAGAANKKFMTVKVAGQDMPVDGQGQIRPLTPEEAKKLADSLKGMLNKSSEGLVQEHKPDGSTELDLQDRFQSVTVARENADGTVSTACVDNPRAAGAFLGIDPNMLRPDRARTTPNPQ